MNLLTFKIGTKIRMPFPNDSVVPFEIFQTDGYDQVVLPGMVRDPRTGDIHGVPTTPGTYSVMLYNDRAVMKQVV